jgi:enoyl-CoA hydratase/carnithine racemase
MMGKNSDSQKLVSEVEGLTVLQKESVLTITLDRPKQLNALNSCLVDELRRIFTALYLDREIRVVVLRGAGQNFCAGLDLRERSETKDRTTDGELVDQRRISEIVIAMRRCQQPIIAVVNGAASGGGFALALASDIRLATPTTRMNAAFIRVGLSACDVGVSYFLPRMVGSSIAAELLLTGRFIDAARALSLGLVSAILASKDVDAEVQLLINDMLRATPLGLRLTKEALNHSIDAQSLEAVVAMEDRNQILCARSDDFAEGIAAFLEKRAPNYASRL